MLLRSSTVVAGNTYVLNGLADSVFFTEPLNVTLHPNDHYQTVAIVNNTVGYVRGNFSLLLEGQRTVSQNEVSRDVTHMFLCDRLMHFQEDCTHLQGIAYTISFNKTTLDKLVKLSNTDESGEALIIKVQFQNINHANPKLNVLSKSGFIHVKTSKSSVGTVAAIITTNTTTDFETSESEAISTAGSFLFYFDRSRCLVLHSTNLRVIMSFVSLLVLCITYL